MKVHPYPNNDPDYVSPRTWIAVLGTLMGAFLAVLNIQVTNASLRDIQGTLSASADEASWITSAYLVAEIIVIPLTGWLSHVFSSRYYILANSVLFLLFSVLCGHAHSLRIMIVLRALQGFTGGVLIPMAFNVILNKLPKSKQPVGLALFGITAVFAPSIGPWIGGWLTDNYGWPFVFYINLVPGALLIAAVWFTLDQEPLQWSELAKGDWLGAFTMVIGLGALEIVLEEGNRKDWFGSKLIVRLSTVALIFLASFIAIELTRKEPLINLRLLGRRNFGLGSLVNTAFGFGLYGSVYVLPVYLGQVQGYNAVQIGKTVAWMGIPQLAIIPFVPRLMKRVDIRILIAFGVLLFGLSCFMMSSMTALTGYDQLRLPQLVRALGQPFILIPISVVATAGIAAGSDSDSASSLFNMMRNLGGSVGVALLATLLTRREQFHSARIGESVSMFDLATQGRLSNMLQGFASHGSDLWTAQWQAVHAIDGIVRRESFVMAFNDCFYVIGATVLLSGIAVLFLKRIHPSAGGGE